MVCMWSSDDCVKAGVPALTDLQSVSADDICAQAQVRCRDRHFGELLDTYVGQVGSLEGCQADRAARQMGVTSWTYHQIPVALAGGNAMNKRWISDQTQPDLSSLYPLLFETSLHNLCDRRPRHCCVMLRKGMSMQLAREEIDRRFRQIDKCMAIIGHALLTTQGQISTWQDRACAQQKVMISCDMACDGANTPGPDDISLAGGR